MESAERFKITFKEMMATGVVPSNCKCAKIVPMYRKGGPCDPLHYGPVSLTTTVGKILEKNIYKNILQHLDYINLLSDGQFEFSDRSYIITLIDFYENHQNDT